MFYPSGMEKSGKKGLFTHDTLIKEHFQHPENALGLIRNGLSPEMFDQLRPETLTHKGIHLATPALLKSVTDLLFSCKLKDGSDAFVHIVLEHK